MQVFICFLEFNQFDMIFNEFSFCEKTFLVFTSITMSTSFVSAQTLYAPTGTVGTSLNNNIGINITTPEASLYINGTFKLGVTNLPYDRVKNQFKFGDGDFVKMGEFEEDNKLSLYAQKGYNFTGGNIGIG